MDDKTTIGNRLNKARLFVSKYGIYFAFLAIVLVISLLTDRFFTLQNLLNVLRQISFNGMMAIGVTFVIVSGGIDLSVGSLLALGGIVSAMFSVSDASPWPTALAVLLGIGVSSGFGAASGFLVAKARVAPFIATLGVMTITRGLSLVLSKGRPIIKLTGQYQWIGLGNVVNRVPVPIAIFVSVALIAHFVLHYTKFGRHVYATGGNERSAIASGVKALRRVAKTLHRLKYLM